MMALLVRHRAAAARVAPAFGNRDLAGLFIGCEPPPAAELRAAVEIELVASGRAGADRRQLAQRLVAGRRSSLPYA
jgi:hypothetical protein